MLKLRKIRGASPYSVHRSGSIVFELQHFVRATIAHHNSKFLGWVGRFIASLVWLTQKKYPTLPVRLIISALQPVDPLRGEEKLPEIDLVVPFVEKDLPVLGMALQNAISNSRNPVGRIRLITPRNPKGNSPRFSLSESHAVLIQILDTFQNIDLWYDQDLLGPKIMEKILSRFGSGDRKAGWITQQLIKFCGVMESTAEASLVLDADTLLLTPRTWLTKDGRQLLLLANEYHPAFMRHAETYFGIRKNLRMSFISHHQLMQKEVVRMMFPLGSASLVSWWESSSDPTGRDLGDYEAYGCFLAHHFPRRISYGSFGNLFSPRLEMFLHDLRDSGLSPSELIPSYHSVSFHAWLQPRPDS